LSNFWRAARQVGKTFIIQRFGEEEFDQMFYLNFDEKPSLRKFFEGDLDPRRIVRDLGISFEKEILPGRHLLVFDEIQECPEALNCLKYFQEEAPEYHIIGAGSLLGVKLAHTKGFPVGKVEFLEMFPLTFLEFLSAIGKPMLKEFLVTKNDTVPISEPIHEELLSLMKFYFIVGGMPEAVAQFISNQDDLLAVRKVQKNILNAYALDFAKHASPSQVMKITTIWNVIPAQLAKENKKFIFSAIQESARAREYEEAIQWLEDAGLIHKTYRITTPKIPLEGYVESKVFKIFLLDVGLLGTMSFLPPKVLLDGHQLFTEFKGALSENFVAQELSTLFEKRLFYWASGADAEVDFVLPIDTEFYPLEVKSGENKRKKSLLVYAEKYYPQLILRTSPMNFHQSNTFLNIPIYDLLAYLNNAMCKFS
jgi:predicted AAA+ superfamily ATPase